MEKFKDQAQRLITYTLAIASVLILFLLVYELLRESLPALKNPGISSLLDPSSSWRPVSSPPSFSLVAAIAGTLYVSSMSVLLALILGLGLSLFVNFYLGSLARQVLLSLIDMLAGIPSVIFGFVGLALLVQVLEKVFDMAAGQCVLAAIIVLGLMLLPFIVSSLSESISSLKNTYQYGSYALGLSKEYFLVKIVVPNLRMSLLSSSLTALARALGETIAVMMVIGNTPILPRLLGRGQTIPALTALEMGNVQYASTHMAVLYAANLFLLIILVLTKVFARYIEKKGASYEK